VTRELSIQDVAGIIERVPDLSGMMLVGGQALNYWAETLGIADAKSAGIYGPATSEDIDIMEMSLEEREEFFSIGKLLKESLNDLFKPDRMNYCNLQNEANHLHIHFIPRYKEPRTFGGQEFTDGRWGKNYAPYDTVFKAPNEVIVQIRDSLKEKLVQQTK